MNLLSGILPGYIYFMNTNIVYTERLLTLSKSVKDDLYGTSATLNDMHFALHFINIDKRL